MTPAADSKDTAHSTVGSGSRAAARGDQRPGTLLDANGEVARRRREGDPVVVVGDEPEVADPVRTRERADCDLGRLHVGRVDRPAAVEVERDPARRHEVDDVGRAFEGDPSELDPVREDDHVGREAVAAEVRGLPEMGRQELRVQRLEERQAEPGAARVAASVGADENDRPRDIVARIEIGGWKVRERADLLSGRRAARFLRAGADDRDPTTPLGAANEQHLAGECGERSLDVGIETAVDDRVPPPCPPRLDEQPARRNRGGARERLAAGERGGSAGHLSGGARHAGRRSARSRASAGSIPSSAANARYSP